MEAVRIGPKSGHLAVVLWSLSLLLSFGDGVGALANCPPGCQCDDNTLIVQCGQGKLDVLPIALNPSIQRLIIRNNKIKTIDSSIQFYAELTFLDLSYNHLVNIPPRTFAYQRKLQEVHLNHNKIGQISNRTFDGLSAVTVLNLRGNFISELHQGTFSALPKIEELNLGENRIGYIDPKAFDGLPQLHILYLDDNALTSIPDPIHFQAMSGLAELYLGMNTLLTIPVAAFQDLKGLTRLDLRGSGLRNISHDSFRGLEELRQLDLSDNRLTRIPTVSLSHLTRLEELFLGQNDFETILEGAFVGLKQLKYLDITGSLRLKRVMNGAFATNTNLEQLKLSSNKMLTEVQEGALSGLPHLRYVSLKGNALTTLAEGLFPWKDLDHLDISENPFACDCRVMWLKNLLYIRNASKLDDDVGVGSVVCEFPERLRGEELKNLSATLMGCAHNDPRKQALIGALLVCTAAFITALGLSLYRCRHRICKYMKGNFWNNGALGRKEREYQKTFCDEDYMTRHHGHPCGLGIHATFPNTYTPHHPAHQYQHQHYGAVCPLPLIGDFTTLDGNSKNFQQLQVPITLTSNCSSNSNNNNSLSSTNTNSTNTTNISNEKKSSLPVCGGIVGNGLVNGNGVLIDDGSTFALHLKGNSQSSIHHSSKPNHYTKPNFLQQTANVGDSCYSYADLPILPPTATVKLHHKHNQLQGSGLQMHTVRYNLFQHLPTPSSHVLQQLQHPQLRQMLQDNSVYQRASGRHYNFSSDDYSSSSSSRLNLGEEGSSLGDPGEVMDPNYIYNSAHYSLPLELTDGQRALIGRTKTPTPPPVPPALPLRNPPLLKRPPFTELTVPITTTTTTTTTACSTTTTTAKDTAKCSTTSSVATTVVATSSGRLCH